MERTEEETLGKLAQLVIKRRATERTKNEMRKRLTGLMRKAQANALEDPEDERVKLLVEALCAFNDGSLWRVVRSPAYRMMLGNVDCPNPIHRALLKRCDEIVSDKATQRALWRARVEYAGQLVQFSGWDLLRLNDIGRVRVAKIEKDLAKQDLFLGMRFHWLPLLHDIFFHPLLPCPRHPCARAEFIGFFGR